jgi:hypothetical protein
LTPEQLRLHKENVMIVVTGATGKLGRLVIGDTSWSLPELADAVVAFLEEPGNRA